jgi:hypothetical protein
MTPLGIAELATVTDVDHAVAIGKISRPRHDVLHAQAGALAA